MAQNRPICWTVLVLSFCAAAPNAAAGAEPNAAAQRQSIGRLWSVDPQSSPATYYFHDPEPLDLFAYHRKDSNKDGIDNVRLSHDARFLIIRSQGYPNHPTAIFPNNSNPNTIRVQDFTFRLPLQPQRSDVITRLPMGPIGVALNGVVFFNPFEAGGMNAVEGYSEVWLDSCCGHPEQRGVYHYHKFPSCLKSPFPDDGERHSPVIGFAFDGFPIYGPYESPGVLAKNLTGDNALDVCNGHTDPVRGYHYHVTPGRFPYIIGGYAGVPEPSNNRQLGRAETGPIRDNATGVSRLPQVIADVRPGAGVRGQTNTVRIELARGAAVPDAAPSWVQFGPFEAQHVTRQGNVVIAEIAVPADASAGVLYDCHLEFAPQNGAAPPRVFKRNDAWRVVDR